MSISRLIKRSGARSAIGYRWSCWAFISCRPSCLIPAPPPRILAAWCPLSPAPLLRPCPYKPCKPISFGNTAFPRQSEPLAPKSCITTTLQKPGASLVLHTNPFRLWRDEEGSLNVSYPQGFTIILMHSLHIAFKRTITNKTYAVCSCPAQKQSGVFCRGWEVEWEEGARPQEDLRGPEEQAAALPAFCEGLCADVEKPCQDKYTLVTFQLFFFVPKCRQPQLAHHFSAAAPDILPRVSAPPSP